MTPPECVRLIRFIAARCPAMKMQEETPEAWYVDLVPFDIADAMEGARVATLDKPFISVGELATATQNVVRRREALARQRELDETYERETGEKRTPPKELSGPPAPNVAAALVVPQKPPVPDYVPGSRSRQLQDAYAAAARDRIAEQKARRESDAVAKAEHDARLAVALAEIEEARARSTALSSELEGREQVEA